MSDLLRAYDDFTKPEPRPQTPKLPAPPGSSEWDGQTGYLQGTPTTQASPAIDDIIRGMGYDPDEVMPVGPVRVSQWQAVVDGELTTLYSHRVRIQARAGVFEMPELDRLVQRARPVKRKPGTGPSTVTEGVGVTETRVLRPGGWQ